MYRVNHPTAVDTIPTPTAPGTTGYFNDGSPSAGVPATRVPADWLNRIQEEIVNVVLAAELELDPDDNTQLQQAIAALAVAGVPDATTTVKGKVELATALETQTGTDGARAVTPAGAAATYLKLIGGTLTGALNAPAFNTTSSRRYKKDIVALTPDAALQLLSLVHVADYLLKKDGCRQVGVIAEQLAGGPLDFVVTRNKHGEPEAVNYQSLFALSMAALQGLTARLAKIERDVEALGR
jgi:hypothetical protein